MGTIAVGSFDCCFEKSSIFLLFLGQWLNLLLVFTHETFALTTVAMRHVGAQTNALDKDKDKEPLLIYTA